MELLSPTPGSSGPSEDTDEVARLRRELERERERARRIVADSFGEQATAELYDSLDELRSAQAELIERAEETRHLGELARSLRQDLDSRLLASRAAESVVHLTDADRCEVLLVGLGSGAEGAVRGTWSRDEHSTAPTPSVDELTDLLAEGLSLAAGRLRPVVLEDVAASELLTGATAAKVEAALGARSLAVVPVAAGGQVAGWMVLESAEPRRWEERHLAMCESLSHDVVTSLLQVQAFEQQRESVRRLEELDRAKDAFISTVSHELRTPLTSIVGYLEMLSDGAFGDPQELRKGLDIIGRNVVRLRELVEDLLTLSAYDAQQVRLQPQPVDVVAVIEECLVSLAPLAREQGVPMTLRVEGHRPRVMGELVQLERAISNVLSNAVKFSRRDDEVEVCVSTAEGDNGPVVLVEVSDQGIGIPVHEQARLFTRFFRSSLAVKEEIPGTGLGLALVQTIMQSHGGRITVDSTEGVGTTVTLSLPAAT